MRIHEVIAKLKPAPESLDVVASMLFIEYHRGRGPRMDVVARLHGKFSKLRYELERKEL